MEATKIDSLFLLGLNHESAALDVRARYALDDEGRRRARIELGESLGVRGAVIVSTCNRTEVYGRAPTSAREDGFPSRLRSSVFPGLGEGNSAYYSVGARTVFHLFRVSAGLDSMVLGESEILGQVKGAYDEALAQGLEDRVLLDLFRQALMVGKRVRSETPIGQGSLSVAATAVKLARKVVGRLEDKTALIIGAGETGVLVARHLDAAGVARMAILNRTKDKAAALASEFGADHGGLDELERRLEEAGVVIACVEAPEPVITASVASRLSSRTRCFIDISVPRAIEPGVADHAGAFVLDLDDIQKLIATSQSERASGVAKADEIIVAEAHKFLSLQSYALFSPLVQTLKSEFDRATDQLVGDERLAERETSLARRLTAKLLGITLESLKTSSRDRHSVDDLRRAYRDFTEDRTT